MAEPVAVGALGGGQDAPAAASAASAGDEQDHGQQAAGVVPPAGNGNGAGDNNGNGNGNAIALGGGNGNGVVNNNNGNFTLRPITRVKFREIMGIQYKAGDANSPVVQIPYERYMTPLALFRSRRNAGGLYNEVFFDENIARWRYHLFNLVINFSLVAQLALSAAVIALGALSRDYHVPVAVIGAVNGVLAGFLSLLKGQGLPNRLMQHRYAMRIVRMEIERLDAQCTAWENTQSPQNNGQPQQDQQEQNNNSSTYAPPVTWNDVKQVFTMHKEAIMTNEANHPDNWNGDIGSLRTILQENQGATVKLLMQEQQRQQQQQL